MLDEKGFDLWADGYDKSVGSAEEANEYPFAGYQDVLNEIYGVIRKNKASRILDIGLGTASLTKKLYDDGCKIYGIDFSRKMIEISKAKMPDAKLMQWDFSNGLPEETRSKSFDYIISTYAIHHLTTTKQIQFVKQLLECIRADGTILIGDVAFKTKTEWDVCKKTSGDRWDGDEIYLVFDEIKPYFPKQNVRFQKVSYCAGILSISR